MQTACLTVDSEAMKETASEYRNLEIQINPVTTVDLVAGGGKSLSFKSQSFTRQCFWN